MRILQGIGRAIIKLALFAFFAHMLAEPFVMCIVSLLTRPFPSIVESMTGITGYVSRLAILYAGMILSCKLTQKVREFRLLQIVIGFATMAGACWLAENIGAIIGSIFGAIVKGILAMGTTMLIAVAILVVLFKTTSYGTLLFLGLFGNSSDDDDN